MTATAERPSTRQVASMETPQTFDPLVEFYGMWTTELAERYLPIPELPNARYECWDGYLFMSPYESAENSFGEARLINRFTPGAEAAGMYVYGTVNLMLGTSNRWIQPDVTVLRSPGRGTWVDSSQCVMVVEFISTSSRRRDRIDKPAACATADIPYYMTVLIDPDRPAVEVELSELSRGLYRSVVKVREGAPFLMGEPFAASFDPVELLAR